MNFIRKHLGFLVLVLLLLLILGYSRLFIFENINFQIYKLYYPDDPWSLPESLKFLERYSMDELYTFKWPLTILYSLFYFGVTWMCLARFFPGKRTFQICIITHVVLFLIAGGFYAYGYLFNDFSRGYEFSRIFMGFLQSPLVLMILFPAMKLVN